MCGKHIHQLLILLRIEGMKEVRIGFSGVAGGEVSHLINSCHSDGCGRFMMILWFCFVAWRIAVDLETCVDGMATNLALSTLRPLFLSIVQLIRIINSRGDSFGMDMFDSKDHVVLLINRSSKCHVVLHVNWGNIGRTGLALVFFLKNQRKNVIDWRVKDPLKESTPELEYMSR